MCRVHEEEITRTTVRSVTADERARVDATLAKRHWLGRPLFGKATSLARRCAMWQKPPTAPGLRCKVSADTQVPAERRVHRLE